MCEQCESIVAAVRLGHTVQFPLRPGGHAEDDITVLPLDEA